MKSFGAFCYEFEKALKHLKSLVKGSKKGKGRDLNKTMHLWPKNTEEIMKKEAGNTFSISRRKSIINTNLQFLQSMKTDRVASYSSLDKEHIIGIEKRKRKASKECLQLSYSSVMQRQETSAIPLVDSCNSDLEVASIYKVPNKHSHKRTKTLWLIVKRIVKRIAGGGEYKYFYQK